MDVGGYRHLPVVDEGKPVGVIFRPRHDAAPYKTLLMVKGGGGIDGRLSLVDDRLS